MNCPKCRGRCNCIDSRKSLTYGITDGEKLIAKEKPIKERKYICKACDKVYITQEYLATSYYGKSKDKRLQPST